MSAASIRAKAISIDHQRFAAQARPLGYLLANGFLAQHAALSAAMGMRPAKLLVYVTIVTATVQKLLRQTDLPEDLHGTSPMSRSLIGYISRRAIAAATGLPRENVRRIVNELLAEDLLIVGPRAALANKGQILSRPEVITALQQVLSEVARMADVLLQAGVLVPETSLLEGQRLPHRSAAATAPKSSGE